MSSLSRLSFSEVGQTELLDEVVAEVALGTPTYAVVEDAFSIPGLGWHREVWMSIHALATPENASRLRSIATSQQAVKARRKFESDVEDHRSIMAMQRLTDHAG